MLEVFFLWSNLPDRFLMPLEKLTTTTGFLVALSFLNFVYVFIERKRDFFFKFFSFVIFSSIFINVFTNLYVKGYQKYTWGASLEGGPLFIELAFLALALPSLYSIYLIHEKYRKASARHEKQQLSLLIQGSLLSYVIIFISDLIVPYIFGIKTFPRIGIPSCAIQSLFVFAAVNKFNFLSIGIEEAAKDLFTNVKDAVILTDNYGNIVQLNDSALEIIGRSAKTVFNIFENYEFNQDYNDYETSVGRDSERIVAISQATIKQGNVGIGKIIIARDITAGKKAERELKSSKEKLEQLAQELARINASLEQKVLERTRSLEEVNAQLRQEIAERRRAEEALAAEKERLAVTLRSIGDGVITTDTAGRIALLNKAAEDMTGWTQEEAIGQPLEAVLRLLDDKTHLPCESLVAEVLRTHDVVSRDRPSLLQARHGQEYLVAENAAPIHDRDGRLVGVVVVFRDVTERRRIEEELLKADKLESIGVLAGGIAHDFNNILTAILGNISLAKLYVGDHPKAAAPPGQRRESGAASPEPHPAAAGFLHRRHAGQAPDLGCRHHSGGGRFFAARLQRQVRAGAGRRPLVRRGRCRPARPGDEQPHH
ncbi:MAG: hypothetical protein KatS3mg131_2592 [Candidatus Tectimicrobiota bacterium]|nr:MAG: hypothetical protein KatS3mg131_2592 [Candidatus Tectomicrobia bacterium]